MGDIDKYDVFMKQLEIIEFEVIQGGDSASISPERKQKMITVIKRIEGNVFLQQNTGEETNMHIGDNFENISQSVIATHGSIAKGIIKVREVNGDEIANAIQNLAQAIAGVEQAEMSEASKQESLQLLDEITKQAASPNPAKVILKQLGNGLWEGIKNISSISTVVGHAWPVIVGLWS